MTSPGKCVLPLLAAAAFAVPAASRAITHAHEIFPSAAVVIDARDFDTPFPASSPTVKIVLNRSDDEETPDANNQSRILFTLPGDVFSVPAERISRALVVFSRTYDKQYDRRPLFLHPLSAPFSLSNATWNTRDAGTPWSTPGGDFLDASVSAVYDESSATIAWDIAPLLADPATAAALRDNGAIVRFDTDKAMGVPFMQLTFASPAYPDDPSIRPSLRYALLDPFADARDFAVSYIDSRDADTVYWEQGLATVGKVILNGDDGSECRAILTMPESLAALPPSLVQSVGAQFDAEIRDWQGEAVFLAPLSTPTKLERHPNNETSPVHGPSWNCADAAVDSNATSYVIGGATFDNASWENAGGDWMADFVVRGAVTAPVEGTSGAAEFDLTALWRDDAARAALLANGAIVFMDPAEFPNVKADKRMARVNLYRPDEIVELKKHAYSWFRVTECERLADDSGAPASVATTYIDSASPDQNFSAANKTLVTLNNAEQGTESRALLQLPPSLLDVDLPSVGSVNLLVSYYRSWPGDAAVNPIALHPAATPFRLDQATWNDADAASDTPWQTPGGDFLDAFVTASDTPAQSMLAFDLAPLLSDPASAAALAANGAVVRMLGDPPQTAGNNGYNVNGALTASAPVIVLLPSDLELELAMDSISADAETGLVRCAVVGFDPFESHRYEVWGTSSLVPVEDDPATQWHRISRLPFDGVFTVSPDAPERFFCVQPVPKLDAYDPILVKGVVINGADGLPIAGARVFEKGTLNIVVTEPDGTYAITVFNKESILVFSAEGFKTTEIPVYQNLEIQNVIDITLDIDSQLIDEVVNGTSVPPAMPDFPK